MIIQAIPLNRPIAADAMAFLNRAALERRRAKLAEAIADVDAQLEGGAAESSPRVRDALMGQWHRRRAVFGRELVELDAALAETEAR